MIIVFLNLVLDWLIRSFFVCFRREKQAAEKSTRKLSTALVIEPLVERYESY